MSENEYDWVWYAITMKNREVSIFKAIEASIKTGIMPPPPFCILTKEQCLKSLKAAKAVLRENPEWREKYPDTYKGAEWWLHYFDEDVEALRADIG